MTIEPGVVIFLAGVGCSPIIAGAVVTVLRVLTYLDTRNGKGP